jgi:hypothetical protein
LCMYAVPRVNLWHREENGRYSAASAIRAPMEKCQ